MWLGIVDSNLDPDLDRHLIGKSDPEQHQNVTYPHVWYKKVPYSIHSVPLLQFRVHGRIRHGVCFFNFRENGKVSDSFNEKVGTNFRFCKSKIWNFFYRCRTKNQKDNDEGVVTCKLPSFDWSGKNQNRLRILSKFYSAVLWLRIWLDPKLLAGSGSEMNLKYNYSNKLIKFDSFSKKMLDLKILIPF
jgi:hypothetical protein